MISRKLTHIRHVICPKDNFIKGQIINKDTGEVLLDVGELLTFEVQSKLMTLIYNNANIYYEEEIEKHPRSDEMTKKVISNKTPYKNSTNNNVNYNENDYEEYVEPPDHFIDYAIDYRDETITPHYNDEGELIGYDMHWVDDHWET